jgi:hypothetical protein
MISSWYLMGTCQIPTRNHGGNFLNNSSKRQNDHLCGHYIFQNTCDHVMPCKVPCTTLKQVARLLVSTGPSEEGSGSKNICQGREFVWGDLGAVLVRPGRGRCEWSGGRRPKTETGALVGTESLRPGQNPWDTTELFVHRDPGGK